MPNSHPGISRDMRAPLTLITDLTRRQGEADEKAGGQLVSMECKL